MPRRTSHDRLRVFLNSRLVGLLRRETGPTPTRAMTGRIEKRLLDSIGNVGKAPPPMQPDYGGTPTFVLAKTSKDTLSGVRLVGAQPYSTFDNAIRQMLSTP